MRKRPTREEEEIEQKFRERKRKEEQERKTKIYALTKRQSDLLYADDIEATQLAGARYRMLLKKAKKGDTKAFLKLVEINTEVDLDENGFPVLKVSGLFTEDPDWKQYIPQDPWLMNCPKKFIPKGTVEYSIPVEEKNKHKNIRKVLTAMIKMATGRSRRPKRRSDIEIIASRLPVLQAGGLTRHEILESLHEQGVKISDDYDTDRRFINRLGYKLGSKIKKK